MTTHRLRTSVVENREKKTALKLLSGRVYTHDSDSDSGSKGSTPNPKIIIFYHGLIVGRKKSIDFPFKRLIYYVNKRHSLATDAFDRSPNTLIDSICSGVRGSAINFKEPINKKLNTWKQKLTVFDSDPLLYRLNMGVYICNAGQSPIKLFGWVDMDDLMKSNPMYSNGVLLEDLLEKIVSSSKFNSNVYSDIIPFIDVNIYACRSCPGDPRQQEQVVGGKSRRIKRRNRHRIKNGGSRSKSIRRNKKTKKIRGGNITNVDENDYKNVLQQPCDLLNKS